MEIFFHTSRQRESKQQSPGKKVGGFARFSFHIFQYIEEMIVSHESLLFSKTV